MTHTKYDFEGQEVDSSACYLTCKEVAELTGRNRTTVFYDVQKGRLPAIWHKVPSKNKYKCSRAYLVHPKDAEIYMEKVKGKARVTWRI